MTHEYELNAGARPAVTEAGTSAVMAAMKTFYRSIELKDLSASTKAELKALSTKENKELVVSKMFDGCSAITTYLNWNINLLPRPAMQSVQSMAEAFSLDLHQEKIEKLKQFRESNEEGAEDKADDFIELIRQDSSNHMQSLLRDRFILKEVDDHYEFHFTLGSAPNILRDYMKLTGRHFSARSIEHRAADLSRSNPSLYAEMEEDAEYFLSRLAKVAGTDPKSMNKGDRARGLVPLGYEFASLFSRSSSSSGEFEVVNTAMPDTLAKKYGKYWELAIEIRKTDGHNTATGALAGLEIAVLPVLKVSREAAWYLTQAQDPSQIKFGVLHTWFSDWQADVYYGEYKQVAYINSLRDNFHFSKKKEELGVKTYDTRADENGIFVDFEGQFKFAPATSAVDEDTVAAYETLYEKLARKCSDTGEPIVMDSSQDHGYLARNPNLSDIVETYTELNAFQSCALISNWDMNICASISPEYPAVLNTLNVAGGAKAKPVGTAEILRSPFSVGIEGLTGESETTANNLHAMPAGHHMASIYAYLRINNKIKDIDEFLSIASTAVAPNGSSLVADDFEYGIYAKVNTDFRTLMSDDCTRFGMGNTSTSWERDNVSSLLSSLQTLQIQQSDFDPKWTLFVQEFNRFHQFFRCWSSILLLGSSTMLRNWEYERAKAAGVPFDGIESSEYYIDQYGALSLLDVIAKKYVVGHAFATMCRTILAYLNEPKNIVLSHDPAAPKPHMGVVPQLPTFLDICEVVGPFAATFGHLIPKSEEILAKADEESKKFVLDESRELDPIPGMKGEFLIFKHQNRALQLLSNEPFAALLDISPGGGKTVIGILDCLQLMAKGKVKLPLFVAPNNLIKNWIKDANATVTDYKFNSIPITGATLNKWGEEKLAQMIKNAPPNTIFHTDMNFIKDHYRKLQVRFLSHAADVYTNLEWMKQFDWDYILFDESHYLKNAKGGAGGSLQSRLFGELTLRDSVKYIRLASGTIIHKDVDDIIGQTRLFDPLIFRTHKDFVEKYSDEDAPGIWAPDAAKRIREHLNRFCAVARAKSRDWAYALPAPKQEHPEKWLVEMGEEFKTVYEHICAKTFEEMENDAALAKILKGDDIDEGLLDDLAPEDDTGVEGRLNVHLSRLEKFLLCPEQDPLNGWNGLDFSKLKAPKMDKLIELLDQQFSRKGHGKVIIFVRHIGAVDGIYARLPAKYQSVAVTYSGGDKVGLVDFRYNPETKILVGVEHSMNTGENLQIADRVIRMEIPWAAGDVEQGIARVFRPDFHNEYERQYIYDDWIIVNDSLEIPKLCRLISSTIRKVQFDEYGSENNAYADLPYLPSMSLNLKRFMNPDAAVRRYDQVTDYFDAYHALSNIQFNEFLEERSRYVDEEGNRIANPYVSLKGGEMMEGSAQLTFTPLMPHQGFVNDRDADGLKPFALWINENREFLADPTLIVEKPRLAYSEFGFGYISSVGRTRKGNIPQTVVMTTNSGADIEVPTDGLYVVGKTGGIKEERIRKYAGVNNKASNYDQYICPDPRDTEGLIFRDDEGYFAEYLPDGTTKQFRGKRPAPKAATPVAAPKTTAAPTAPKVKVKVAEKVEQPEEKVEPAAAVKKLSKLEELRQRIKAKRAEKTQKVTETNEDDDSYVPENTGEDGKIRGSLCVVSDSLYLTFNAKDPDTSPLTNLKFTRVKPFVGIEIKSLLEFNAAISFIESKFTIYNADQISDLRKRFSKKTKLFNGQFDPTDNKFLTLNYKPVKNPKNIKLYYIIEDGKLYLVFNAEAHPAATKALLNKKPAGVSEKFEKHDTTLMRSVLSKRAALSVLNKVKALVEIVNYDEIVEAIGELTLV